PLQTPPGVSPQCIKRMCIYCSSGVDPASSVPSVPIDIIRPIQAAKVWYGSKIASVPHPYPYPSNQAGRASETQHGRHGCIRLAAGTIHISRRGACSNPLVQPPRNCTSTRQPRATFSHLQELLSVFDLLFSRLYARGSDDVVIEGNTSPHLLEL